MDAIKTVDDDTTGSCSWFMDFTTENYWGHPRAWNEEQKQAEAVHKEKLDKFQSALGVSNAAT
jgi:hypothetical protein